MDSWLVSLTDAIGLPDVIGGNLIQSRREMCLPGFPCVDKLSVGESQAWVTLFCRGKEKVMRHPVVILLSSVHQLLSPLRLFVIP